MFYICSGAELCSNIHKGQTFKVIQSNHKAIIKLQVSKNNPAEMGYVHVMDHHSSNFKAEFLKELTLLLDNDVTARVILNARH